MKKVINGAMYDTNTAKKLGEWTNGERYGDFSYMAESLYRTKAGRYFIYGTGGANSKYAVSAGNNSWSGGSRIEPISREVAMKWAEEHLDGDEYEEIFGEVSEEEGKEQLNVLIAAELNAKLRLKAEKDGTTVSAMVKEALNKLVESK